jgi:hypothetical protein
MVIQKNTIAMFAMLLPITTVDVHNPQTMETLAKKKKEELFPLWCDDDVDWHKSNRAVPWLDPRMRDDSSYYPSFQIKHASSPIYSKVVSIFDLQIRSISGSAPVSVAVLVVPIRTVRVVVVVVYESVY